MTQPKEQMNDEVRFMVFAGELSTQDNLKHLHPELVNQIVQQTWLKAKEHYQRHDSLDRVLEEVLKEFNMHLAYCNFLNNEEANGAERILKTVIERLKANDQQT